MRRPAIAVAALSVFAFALAFAVAADAGTHESMAKKARVSMPQARAIALKAYPGKIVKEELEKESGGSGLRYSFDITSGADTHEVGVDAATGNVLEDSPDNGAKD